MQPVASAKSSSLSQTKQHHEHPKFDRIMLSKIEIAQDKMVDLLHDFQSMAQNCNEPAFFNKCAEHIQEALQSITTDSLGAEEITGPINWALFGERLLHRRTEAKLTQKEIGARVGVSATFVRFIENGSKSPSRATLLRLLAVPELKLKVSDVVRRSPDDEDIGWMPNSMLSPRYDPVTMVREMTGVLNGSGGQLEQSHLYLDPQSAADWMASCNAAAYIAAYRSSLSFETIAKEIAAHAGKSILEVNALGCGDGRTEVMLVQHLANHLQKPSKIRLNLIDISHSLLNVAHKHAYETLQGIPVYAVHGNFHDLPRFPRGPLKSKPTSRLYTMMGYTMVNLHDEIRFFRDTLSSCESGDLFLADTLIAYAPPENPDEIQRLDPALKAGEVRLSHAAWLGGPIRRYCAGAVDVKFSLELDTRCPVPGSYGLDFIATVKMAGGKPDRRFLMWKTRRYDPQKLADTLDAVGWEPKQILIYGPDGTKNLAALLFRKR